MVLEPVLMVFDDFMVFFLLFEWFLRLLFRFPLSFLEIVYDPGCF